MSGSAFVDIVQHGSGDLSVSAIGSPSQQGPHTYGGGVFVGPSALVTLTMSNCMDQSQNGTSRVVPVVQGGAAPFDTGGGTQQSPEGIHYNGTRSVSGSGISMSWSWTLTGSK